MHEHPNPLPIARIGTRQFTVSSQATNERHWKIKAATAREKLSTSADIVKILIVLQSSCQNLAPMPEKTIKENAIGQGDPLLAPRKKAALFGEFLWQMWRMWLLDPLKHVTSQLTNHHQKGWHLLVPWHLCSTRLYLDVSRIWILVAIKIHLGIAKFFWFMLGKGHYQSLLIIAFPTTTSKLATLGIHGGISRHRW